MNPSTAISEPEKGDIKVLPDFQTPPVAGTTASDLAKPEGQTEIVRTENNTVVVPAQKEGFERVFLGENCWHAIRISSGMLEKVRFIAAYQTAPVSAITHTAPVERIELYGKEGKYKLIFSEPAKKLEHPIPYGDTPRGYMQGPKYTSFARLTRAKRVADLFD
jgi:hypothetical protein